MSVGVRGEPDRRMTEQIHDRSELLALVKQERGESMPKVVQLTHSSPAAERAALNRRFTFLGSNGVPR